MSGTHNNRPNIKKLTESGNVKLHELEKLVNNYHPNDDWANRVEVNSEFGEWLESRGTKQYIAQIHDDLKRNLSKHSAKRFGHISDLEHIIPDHHYELKLSDSVTIGQGENAKKISVQEGLKQSFVDIAMQYLEKLGVKVSKINDIADLDERVQQVAFHLQQKIGGRERSFEEYVGKFLLSKDNLDKRTVANFYDEFVKMVDEGHKEFSQNTMQRLSMPVAQYFQGLDFDERVDQSKKWVKKWNVPVSEEVKDHHYAQVFPHQWYGVSKLAKEKQVSDELLARLGIDPKWVDKSKIYSN